MVFNVCVKFHENMSSGFKVMERTRKVLTDTDTHTHTHTKDENIIPPQHTSYAGGINMEYCASIMSVFDFVCGKLKTKSEIQKLQSYQYR